MRSIEVPSWFKLEVQKNLDMQSLSPEPDHPDIILYRRKLFPVFCLFFRKAQWFVFGDWSTRTLTWKKSSGLVLPRTQLLFWHHNMYVAWSILHGRGKFLHVAWQFSYVTVFFVQKSMLQAGSVWFIFARALNFLYFSTTLYCMRSCNIHDVQASSTKLDVNFHEYLALQRFWILYFSNKHWNFLGF